MREASPTAWDENPLALDLELTACKQAKQSGRCARRIESLRAAVQPKAIYGFEGHMVPGN